MTKYIRATVIASVFLIGCAVGGAASRFVVPPASAQQQAMLTKWEYFCFGLDGIHQPEDVTTRLNQAAREGWELATAQQVGAQGGTWCMRRQLP